MSPSPPPSPLSLCSLVDDDDDEHQCDEVHHLLKINVLYNKKHSAFPTPGKLTLSKKNLVFRNNGPLSPGGSSYSSYRIIAWELNSITVEKYRGKISGGIKIIPIVQPKLMAEENEGGEEKEFDQREEKNYMFTMVNDRSYRIIQDAIHEAKLDSAMKRVRREALEKMENSSGSLSETSDDYYGGRAAEQRVPFSVVRPRGFIFLMIIRIISYVFRICTGRRLSGPRDMYDALHAISTNTHQISWAASKLSLSEGRMRSIQKDVESIRKSITQIKQAHMRCQSTYMSCGSVAEASTTSRAFLETTGVSVAKIVSIVAFVCYAIRRAINMPFFRIDQLRLARYPPTVAGAVRDANDMVDAVIDLAWKDARDSSLSSKIDEEGERIRVLLSNIKLCCTVGD